jgi:Zn-dependent protease with chaperone function
MIDLSQNHLFGIFSFIFFFICSIYFVSVRKSFFGKIMLVILSYVQGLILAIIFYSDTIFNLFTAAILFGIFYYILISKLSMLFEFLIQKIFKKIQSSPNNELINEIATMWQTPTKKIQISTYPGENSDNAFRKLSLSTVDIYIGEIFLNKVNKDELLFTLSHEVAHTKTFWYIIYPVIFAVIYDIVCLICLVFLLSVGLFNVPIFFIFSIILFIIGIMIINYFSWLNEYKADELGLIKSKKIDAAISLFSGFLERQKNYGIVINLIFYDHPNPEYRIEKLKKISL